MGLFSKAQIEVINQAAEKSNQVLAPATTNTSKSLVSDIEAASQEVTKYFADSKAILITSRAQLHDYVTDLISCEYAGIDTETTGLDRVRDHVVGSSLYFPGGVECYIPNRHIIPLFDEPYKGQLTYEEVHEEFDRIRQSKVKLIFANADFDLSMIFRNFNIDFCDRAYYDVILAWRCIKDDERDNSLKGLYNKYVLRGRGDPKKFSDFFTPTLFPYCKPDVAKLYAANDAKITYDLFRWQLPFITHGDPKCTKRHLDAVADLIWNVEFPLMRTCQQMHRTGVYLDKAIARPIQERYNKQLQKDQEELARLVDEQIRDHDTPNNRKRPFRTGKDFNPNSTTHCQYLIYTLMKLSSKEGTSTSKEVLHDFNQPITNQILKVRSDLVLINTFVEKMPRSTTDDSRIHASFKQIGAATGRFSSESPNVQNIPSHADDIRHMFRATAAHKENRLCTQDNDTSVLELSTYDRVYKDGHVETVVHDLVVGDKIEALDDKTQITMIIQSIDKEDLSPTTRLHLVRAE